MKEKWAGKQQPDFMLVPNLSKYAFATAGYAIGWATYPFNFSTSKIAIQFFFSFPSAVCRRIKLLCGEVSRSNSSRFSGKDRCRMSKCQRVSPASLSRDFVWCLFSSTLRYVDGSHFAVISSPLLSCSCWLVKMISLMASVEVSSLLFSFLRNAFRVFISLVLRGKEGGGCYEWLPLSLPVCLSFWNASDEI